MLNIINVYFTDVHMPAKMTAYFMFYKLSIEKKQVNVPFPLKC